MDVILDRQMQDESRDLIAELLSRNTVTVQKHTPKTLRGITKRILVEEQRAEVEQHATLAHLLHTDHLRVVSGRKPVFWAEFVRRLGGDPIAFAKNLRVNDGIDYVYNQLSGTAVAIASNLGLSNNTTAVGATDHATSTLPWNTSQAVDHAADGTTGEWTALGLVRKVATTNTHSASATTYVLAATWTASATSTSTSKIGLFGGTGAGTQGTGVLVLANTFAGTTLANLDTLTVTWTITI